MDVRSAAVCIIRFTRCYLAHQKLLDFRESEDPNVNAEKKRDALLKILYPAKHGRGKVGLSGKRRKLRLPVRVAGETDADDVEYMEMPKFAIHHEGWLYTKIGKRLSGCKYIFNRKASPSNMQCHQRKTRFKDSLRRTLPCAWDRRKRRRN